MSGIQGEYINLAKLRNQYKLVAPAINAIMALASRGSNSELLTPENLAELNSHKTQLEETFSELATNFIVIETPDNYDETALIYTLATALLSITPGDIYPRLVNELSIFFKHLFEKLSTQGRMTDPIVLLALSNKYNYSIPEELLMASMNKSVAVFEQNYNLERDLDYHTDEIKLISRQITKILIMDKTKFWDFYRRNTLFFGPGYIEILEEENQQGKTEEQLSIFEILLVLQQIILGNVDFLFEITDFVTTGFARDNLTPNYILKSHTETNRFYGEYFDLIMHNLKEFGTIESSVLDSLQVTFSEYINFDDEVNDYIEKTEKEKRKQS
jgi:hypothetical protein